MKNWVNLTKHEGTSTIVDTTLISGLTEVKEEDLSYSTFRFQLGPHTTVLEYENKSDAIKERGLILSAIFDNEINVMFGQEK